MNFSKLVERLSHRYDNSVIRRTTILVAFILPAFLANLFVHYFATHILSSQNFGIFYVAITLTNVLFSGSTLLHITYTRHLIEVGQEHNHSCVVAAMYRIQRSVATWGIFISLGLFVGLLLTGKSIGVQSTLLVFLIILDTYVSYLADLGRVYLQSVQRVFYLGAFTLLWMGLRLVFCLIGMYEFGTAWAALLGSVIAALIVFAGFQISLNYEKIGKPDFIPPLPSLRTLGSIFVGYGFLTIISNLDIFLAYFILKGNDIGIYSSSSVFPKGILVVITPLIQMLFGVMVAGNISEEVFRKIVRKSFGVVSALTIAGVSSVWLLAPWMCGGKWGLHLCDRHSLSILLLSVVPLSLLRISVVLDFVHKRDHLPLWLSVPVLIYVVIAWRTKPTFDVLAEQFALFSLTSFLFFIATQRINAWRTYRQNSESLKTRTE